MNADLSGQAPKSPTKLRYSTTPYNRYISIDEEHDLSINSPPSPQQRLQQFSSAEYLKLEPVLDVPPAQPAPKQSTADIFKTQFKALINKNITLQKKQMGTNICQLLTPVICLFLLFIVKNVIDSKIGTKLDLQMDFPYVFNIPYKRLYNNMFTPIYINNCLQWYLFDFENASSSTKDFIYSSKKIKPLLKNLFSDIGNSQDFYYCSGNKKINPYFNLPTNGSINNQIYDAIEYLNGQVYTSNRDIPGLYRLPDGAITFYEASLKNLSYKIQINDINSPEYHRGNGITKFYYGNYESGSTSAMVRTPDGQIALIDLLSRSYMSMINPNVVLTSGSQYMPMAGIETNFLLKLLSMTETILYPISLSLLLAVFMYTLVLEKEERLREMMKMNGMKMSNYWFVNYIWNFFLYLPSAIFFLLFGYFVVRMPFFVGTSIFILIFTVIGWGASQISLSFFFQNFFYKSQMVTVIGYMLSVWTTIICVALNMTIFPDPQTMPLYLNLYPPFAFCRLIYNLCTKCADNNCVSSFSNMTSEMWINLVFLYIGAGIFLALGLYLEQVLPQEYGVAKHPLFFIKDLPFFKNKNKEKDQLPRISVAPRLSRNTSLFTEDQEDEDVHEERKFVARLGEEDYDKYPLIVKNLRKVYRASGGKPSKVAVKNFSLHISKGELFGLLGPNGAGKTSLISMLTGLYKPEKGNAWIAGYGITDQIDEVRTNMGVCPQFDLLWPELTVREHLLFYARMRGIPVEKEKEMVDRAIEEVRLTQSADFKTRQLSGGMKRRLSVAIAMVGDPKIIFFDEPTTGLDPENRRQLWDILAEARGNRAMVLTTHSMEEADVLCTRIGIVTKGQLRCIGPQTKLKSQYGSGYSLIINCQTDNLVGAGDNEALPEHLYQKITDFVENLLPKAELKSVFNGNFVFEVPLEGLSISKIFESLEANKEELGISDWGISQSTLEDVFMEVVEQADEFPTINFRPS